MKKSDVLRYLPNVKLLATEARSKAKESTRLAKEAEKARLISDKLSGVTLYEGFPLIVVSHDQGFEVHSGCDEIKRSSYVETNSFQEGLYVVTNYSNSPGSTDGVRVSGRHKRPAALRLAKDYVAGVTPKASRQGI